MATRSRLSTRRIRDYGNESINIRVGTRQGRQRYHEIQVTGPRDGPHFARMIEKQARTQPGEPLIIAINGHQPWLGDILSTCIEDYWDQISDLNRELQFSTTVQFPQKASKRGKYVPWTFIVDQINVPEVYYWSLGLPAPAAAPTGLINIDRAKLRVGVWFCAHNACKFDRKISTTIIFTRPDKIAELVVRELLFEFLHKDEDFHQPREDEEGICWTFSRLYWLLTDWQNVVREFNTRLEEAEINSHHRHFPVKYRTRTMHNEIALIYELREYLRFHNRSFTKLQKLRGDVPKKEQNDALWDDMDDAVEDLEQFAESLNSLKERFDNLLSLEFNIKSSDQSENSAFLSRIATIFLPVSFLASLWGITTSQWDILWYAYAAAPVFVLSVAFLLIYPSLKQRWQRGHYHLDQRRTMLMPRDFTMLGADLPDIVDVPGGRRAGRSRHKSHQIGDAVSDRREDRSRSRYWEQDSPRREKSSGY